MADTNGPIFKEKSDIEKLIDKLNSIFDVPQNDRNKGTSAIPQKPGYEHFNRWAGNLGMIVPMGFIMIHNDLAEIEKGLGGGGGKPSNLSWQDVANNLVSKLPAMAGILAGAKIASTLIQDVPIERVQALLEIIPTVASDLISKVGGALIDLIREGGLAVADVYDYFTNPDTIEQRRALAKQYLTLSYAQLYEGLGYSVDMDPTTGEIKGFRRKAVTGEDVTDVIGAAGGIASSMLTGSSGFLGKLGKGLGDSALTKTFNVETWVNSISGLIQENMRGLTATIMDVGDLITDDEIAEVRKDLLKVYLQGYYGNLISALGFGIEYTEDGKVRLKEKSTGMQIVDEIKDIGEEAYTAWQTGGANIIISEFSNVISESLTKLAGAISSVMDLLGDDTTVRSMSSQYAGLYMQAYYASLIKDLGYGVDFENDRLKDPEGVTAVKTGIKDLFPSLSDIVTNGVKGIASAVLSGVAGAIATDALVNSDEAKAVSNNYAPLYIEAYWVSMIESMGFQVDLSGETPKVTSVATEREVRKGLFKTVTEWFTGDDTTKINSAITTEIKNNASTIVGEAVNEGDWGTIVAPYIGSFFESYFEAQSYDMSVRSKSDGKWYWFNTQANSLHSTISSYLISNVGSILDRAKYSINTTAGITTFFSTYFNEMADDVTKNPSSWIMSSTDKQALAHSIMESLSNTFSSEEIRTTIVNEGRDYSRILNAIASDVMLLKQSIGDMDPEELGRNVSKIAVNSGNTYGAEEWGDGSASYNEGPKA